MSKLARAGRVMVEERMIAGWVGTQASVRILYFGAFLSHVQRNENKSCFYIYGVYLFHLCVNDLSIDFLLQFYSCFFTYKESGPFLNTELGFMLLRLPVHWVTCTPSK